MHLAYIMLDSVGFQFLDFYSTSLVGDYDDDDDEDSRHSLSSHELTFTHGFCHIPSSTVPLPLTQAVTDNRSGKEGKERFPLDHSKREIVGWLLKTL